MTRIINFNAGPATLPVSVLEQVQAELLDFENSGMSLLEHSHRGSYYAAVHAEAKSLFRELMEIPESHEILFMQGGASGQFAILPMNFLRPEESADYVLTGIWSVKALAEAQIVGRARVAADASEDGTFTRVPKELNLDPKAAYVHYTSNNTVAGTQFHHIPDTGSVPLVADMSSDILSRPIDVSKFSLIYAGAQKNLGPAGITIVIARKDWIDSGRTDIPKIFRYATVKKADSLQNTPPTFAIYMVRNVLAWIKQSGGAAAMESRNQAKANLLYGALSAQSEFYHCPVDEDSRSIMNAVFRLPTEELNAQFVADAAAAGFGGIKGHRSVGGIRVSMYNAMELSGVESLVSFMTSFATANG